MLDLLSHEVIDALTFAANPTDTMVRAIVRSVNCPAWICSATPDFNAFGNKFVALMTKGWAAFWGLVLLLAFFNLLFKSLHMRAVNKKNDPTKKAEARSEVLGAIWGVVGAVLVPVILLTILSFIG